MEFQNLNEGIESSEIPDALFGFGNSKLGVKSQNCFTTGTGQWHLDPEDPRNDKGSLEVRNRGGGSEQNSGLYSEEKTYLIS